MKSLVELKPLIIEWAKERNILFPENAPKQRLKLIEECGELASAILKNNVELQKDAIGDIFVVLVILSEQTSKTLEIEDFEHKFKYIDKCLITIIKNSYKRSTGHHYHITGLLWICKDLNLDLTECANIAWNEIKDRKGKTVNGTFIKN